MSDMNKPQVTGDGAVELEEAALDRTSGGSEPPDPSRAGIIAVNKIKPGTIGAGEPPEPGRTRAL